jgi:tetratricopeptide (TPR) repeat protein
VTASADGTARVWEASTGRPVSPALRHRDGVSWAGFSLDGEQVVTACGDGTAQVWQAATGRHVLPPFLHSGPVNYAAFNAAGDRILTASTDGIARVWDARTGRPLSPPLEQGGEICQAAFSADGRRVLTAAHGATARAWDAGMPYGSGAPLIPAIVPGDVLTCAAFSPDGSQILVGAGADVSIWRLARDARPAGDLLLLAQLLSGQRIDPDVGVAPAEDAALRRAWATLRGKYAADFVPSRVELAAWHAERAADAERGAEWAAALEHRARISELRPEDEENWLRRGFVASKAGRWPEAAAGCLRAIQLDPSQPIRSRAMFGLACLMRGDAAGYRQSCAALLARGDRSSSPEEANTLAAACAFGAAAPPDRERALQLARQAVAAVPGDCAYRNTLGSLLYRRGDMDGAIRHLEAAIALQGIGGTAYDHFFLAMAHHRLGHPAEARRWFARGERWTEQGLRSEGPEPAGFSWSWRLEIHLLRREAAALLGRPVGSRQ